MNAFMTARDGKAKLDEDAAFKARVRGVRRMGQWAAERLGLEGDAATDYAKSLVEADFELPGNDDVVAKLLLDLPQGSVTADQLHAQLALCLAAEDAPGPR
ncbi:MAG: DUF1476 family protein [Alphaproteobacteria bacterium]|nr:DUF1476 family protein [Alphaproteobacteria bacterium]